MKGGRIEDGEWKIDNGGRMREGGVMLEGNEGGEGEYRGGAMRGEAGERTGEEGARGARRSR